MTPFCWTRLIWLCAYSQILTNIQSQSVDGLALPFLANWLFGDITNLVGCILTDQLPFQVSTCRLLSPLTFILNSARTEIPCDLFLLRRRLSSHSILLLFALNSTLDRQTKGSTETGCAGRRPSYLCRGYRITYPNRLSSSPFSSFEQCSSACR